MTNILVTGAAGFVGRNLIVHLGEHRLFGILPVLRDTRREALEEAAGRADVVVHLAGENRPINEEAFETGNVSFTRTLCAALIATGRQIPVIFASSVQAALDNPYGTSKRRAEAVLSDYAELTGAPVVIYRLPNIFGKWCRPNYNSVVATFCHNIARGLPIRIDEPYKELTLAYVDDLVEDLIRRLSQGVITSTADAKVSPQYTISVGKLAELLADFNAGRQSLRVRAVGAGFERALYATFLSYLPSEQFSYSIPENSDHRGRFVEMLKTDASGQLSFFTAHPGVTRGGHYHHSKVEKFLVVQGAARFRFRHIVTQETHVIETSGGCPQVVESIPGWSHDVTNTGDDLLIVMLWANENFDPNRPDTTAHVV